MGDVLERNAEPPEKVKESLRSRGKKLVSYLRPPKAKEDNSRSDPRSTIAPKLQTTPQHFSDDEMRPFPTAAQFKDRRTDRASIGHGHGHGPPSAPRPDARPRRVATAETIPTNQIDPNNIPPRTHRKEPIVAIATDINAQINPPAHVAISNVSDDDDDDDDDDGSQPTYHHDLGDMYTIHKAPEAQSNEALVESHADQSNQHGQAFELQNNEITAKVYEMPEETASPDPHKREPRSNMTTRRNGSIHELSAPPQAAESIQKAYGVSSSHGNGAARPRTYRAYNPDEYTPPNPVAQQAAMIATNQRAMDASRQISREDPRAIPHSGALVHIPREVENINPVAAQPPDNATNSRAGRSMLDIGEDVREAQEDSEPDDHANQYLGFEHEAPECPPRNDVPEKDKRRSKKISNALRPKKSSSKKSSQIRKSAPENPGSREPAVSQKNLVKFIKDYKIPLGPYEDHLSALLNWAHMKVFEGKQKDDEIAKQAKTLNENQVEVAKIKDEYWSYQQTEQKRYSEAQDVKRQLEEAKNDKSNLRDIIENITKAMDDLQREVELAIGQRNEAQEQTREIDRKANEREDQWKVFHKEQMVSLKDAHEQKVGELESELQQKCATYEDAAREQQQAHEKEISNHNTTIQGLRRRVATYSTTTSHSLITDDEFRDTFQGLARRIHNLIQWVPRPESLHLDQDHDPSQFLTRNAQQGGRNWPKFVRNLCWRTILRGLYSHGLGFGALGASGKGFDELDQIRQLFAVPDPQDPSGMTMILHNTKEVNAWRAYFFEALLKGVRSDATHNKYVSLFRDHLESVTDELVSVLQHITSHSVDPRIRDEVAGLVEGLGVLALEAGAQRAQVCLEGCDYGDRVAVGDRFTDEDMMGQGTMTVDLMTQPCLRRIGDGREDLTMQRVVVKGNFVPLRVGN